MFYTLDKTLQLLKHSPKTSPKDLGKVSFKLEVGVSRGGEGSQYFYLFIYLLIIIIIIIIIII